MRRLVAYGIGYAVVGVAWYLVFTQVGISVNNVRVPQPPAAPDPLPPSILTGALWPWSVAASVANYF
jgi:hypothetical protein